MEKIYIGIQKLMGSSEALSNLNLNSQILEQNKWFILNIEFFKKKNLWATSRVAPILTKIAVNYFFRKKIQNWL